MPTSSGSSELNPGLNAVVTLDADGARAAADAADAALAAGDDVGPLHGLPVAHKDTHATGGMRTTWGSPLHPTPCRCATS